MIREATFESSSRWSKPFVSEVAEIINLLKEYGYDGATLARLTGLQEKKISDWMSRYKREPEIVSNIPYPCWCFLAALAGRPNIQNSGQPIEVDARKVMRAFKPTAFKNCSAFEMPSEKEFKRVIGENTFTGITIDSLCDAFQWKPAQLAESLTKGTLPFLNWCLILMLCGFNVQKMLLNQHEGEISLN
ncbi:hypothetical protein C9I98_04345 [Photobacterium sanctipauli]|uniref:Uncharacterized protein n=1 Tax=Photobacterium sanctipauli TaxID=1342794 RepID=A0A2T3NYB1_9GAMM|nr:hypothetical protein [Photobacterium sanctipauli]PSW21188.1 hypothetical protein C9I98_04345 [Photobacterium sanctipauli]